MIKVVITTQPYNNVTNKGNSMNATGLNKFSHVPVWFNYLIWAREPCTRHQNHPVRISADRIGLKTSVRIIT